MLIWQVILLVLFHHRFGGFWCCQQAPLTVVLGTVVFLLSAGFGYFFALLSGYLVLGAVGGPV